MAQAPAGGRIPPNSLQAEKSVLGAMMLSQEAMAVAAESLVAADFYYEINGRIFEAMMRLSSERQVKTDLLLDAIAKAEGIEATEEDKKEFYDKLAADYGEEADKIKEMIDENLMTQDIIRRKAAEVIYESAVKTEPKPAEEEGEEAAPAEEEAASTEEAGD